jgi:hypothetical protein
MLPRTVTRAPRRTFTPVRSDAAGPQQHRVTLDHRILASSEADPVCGGAITQVVDDVEAPERFAEHVARAVLVVDEDALRELARPSIITLSAITTSDEGLALRNQNWMKS